MTENEIARQVEDAGYRVYTALGPGLLETVYEVALSHELAKRGLKTVRQRPVRIAYDGIEFDEGFRADLIVEDKLIVELKSVEALAPVHFKQLLTYLRLADKRLGLLMNFGQALYREGVKRVINGLQEENGRTLTPRRKAAKEPN